MKHLTLFQTEAEYNSATLELPNVSFIEENTAVKYNPNVSKLTTLEILANNMTIKFDDGDGCFIPENYFIKQEIKSWKIKPKDNNFKIEDMLYLGIAIHTIDGLQVLNMTLDMFGNFFEIDITNNQIVAHDDFLYNLNSEASAENYYCIFLTNMNNEYITPIDTIWKYELA